MANELREQTQSQIARLITKGLEQGTISEERAREIARTVLDKIPDDITHEELIKVIPSLDDEFTELQAIVLPIMIEYESKIKNAVEFKVLELVRAKKFKEALSLARQGIDYTREYVSGS